jgi:hypothetical protein
MMVSEIMVRRLLIDAPGRALCDQCLSVACAATLTEMREVTATLLRNDPVFQRGAARWPVSGFTPLSAADHHR